MKLKYSITQIIQLFLLIIISNHSSVLNAQTVLSSSLASNTVVSDLHEIRLTPGFFTNGKTLSAVITSSYTSTPTTSKNYIQTITAEVASTNVGVSTFCTTVKDVMQVNEDIEYFDGLGRPLETVSVAGSPGGKDIVQPYEYDTYGRQSKKYLPYVKTAGEISGNQFGSFDMVTSPTSPAIVQFYSNAYGNAANIANTTTPYAQTKYENSPLNRVIEQGAAGNEWQPYSSNIANSGHTSEFEYSVNLDNDVLYFEVVNNNLSTNSNYGLTWDWGELTKIISKDENWTTGQLHTSEKFTDFEGRVIMKRTFVYNNTTHNVDPLETHYVYDVEGRLRFVLPPEFSSMVRQYGLSSSTSYIDKYCYQYKYDNKNRMVYKKLPGADPVYLVYDNRDRLVLTQDGNLRKDASGNDLKKWMFTKYDQFNRPILTGIYTYSSVLDQAAMQQVIDNSVGTSCAYFETPIGTSSGGAMGYTSNSFPIPATGTTIEYLTATYYDSYSFLNNLPPDESINSNYYNNHVACSNEVKGLITGTNTKVLNSNIVLSTINYYDDRYRLIQSIRNLYDNAGGPSTGIESTITTYNFTGKPIQVHQEQSFGGSASISLDKYYTYDHVGRLIKTEQKIGDDVSNGNNGRVTVSEMAYNEIGQLVDKKLHGGLQSIDYTYNIRGWLKSINNPDDLSNDGTGDSYADLFAERILYNSTETGLSNLYQYNGNISGMVWNSTQKTKQAYSYSYDEASRLIESGYYTNNGTSWSRNANNNFEERAITYDRNGNIKNLTRTSATSGVQYPMNYDGNLLNSVSGIGLGTYTYDKNGNCTFDGLRGITVNYNILNLPSSLSRGSDNILYIYAANGEKLAKRLTNASLLYYAGNMVYDNSKSLSYILFDEGVVRKVSGGYTYEYNLKDHLGNTRVVFKPNGSSPSVLQVAEYYPFGKVFTPMNPSNDNKYLYNGKEIQDDVLGSINLDWYDYGARFYDPQIGRWHSIDPLIEKHFNFTPYSYVYNNPINLIDPIGCDSATFISYYSQYYDVNDIAGVQNIVNQQLNNDNNSGNSTQEVNTQGSSQSDNNNSTGGNNSTSEDGKKWRPYNLTKNDVEGMTAVATTVGGVGLIATSAELPVVPAATAIVAGTINTAVTVDAIFDYRDIINPKTSDKVQLGANLLNYGIGIFYAGALIPSAVFSIMDLNGSFDNFYLKFNKK